MPSANLSLDLRFEDAVTEYIKTSWSTWAQGESIGQCLIANAGSITKEAKEAVIEQGIEEASDSLSGAHSQSLGSAWDLCESKPETTSVSSSEKTTAITASPTSVPILDFESAQGHENFADVLQKQFKEAVDEHFDAATEKAGISVAVYQGALPLAVRQRQGKLFGRDDCGHSYPHKEHLKDIPCGIGVAAD
jgi:hypothetical protein